MILFNYTLWCTVFGLVIELIRLKVIQRGVDTPSQGMIRLCVRFMMLWLLTTVCSCILFITLVFVSTLRIMMNVDIRVVIINYNDSSWVSQLGIFPVIKLNFVCRVNGLLMVRLHMLLRHIWDNPSMIIHVIALFLDVQLLNNVHWLSVIFNVVSLSQLLGL
jgi:hypothetical protein